MRKDFKTGLIVGLFILILGVVWLSTQTVLSPEQKLAASQQQAQSEPTIASPVALKPVTLQQQTEPTPASPIQETPPLSVIPEPSQAQPTTPPPVAQPVAKPKAQPRYHIVQSGETLSEIAYQHYQSYNAWHKIQAANPDQLSNPNKLKVGMRLLIPE